LRLDLAHRLFNYPHSINPSLTLLGFAQNSGLLRFKAVNLCVDATWAALNLPGTRFTLRTVFVL
jgi:hypothetical protein